MVRTTHAFTSTLREEPHRQRQRELLARHPRIRALYGYDRRPIPITAVALVLQFAIAAHLERLAAGSWWSPPVAAYLIGAFLNHWGGVVIHEASHNLCAPTTLQNRWIAIFANLSTPVPSAMSFRRYHLAHHRYLGVEGLDNDLPTRFEVDHLGGCPAIKAVWILLFPLFATLARGFLRRPSRWEIIGLAVQMSVNALVVALLGWTAMAYLLWSTLFAYGLHPVAGHFIHEHYLWTSDQETYSYYGPLNALTWNMGYHNEHHDFVRIPGSRLPELRRIAAETYGALLSHDSWTAILLHFIRTPWMGHHSRMVRPRATARTPC